MSESAAFREAPLLFECSGETLVGIVCAPPAPDVGVVIVVGGPQYRVGSHRQFVHLARALASAGVATLRFDVRGMGDASGDARSFEDLERDIASAIAALLTDCPGIKRMILWGLCDGASAALFYAHRDERIRGIVLVNPWVRTNVGQAKIQLRRYYVDRLRERAFWSKVFGGQLNARASLQSLRSALKTVFDRRNDGAEAAGVSLPDRMVAALRLFQGETLVLLSGRDLTAAEFEDVAANSEHWRGALSRARIERREEADHTMSSASAKEWVAHVTSEWIRR